MTISATAEKPGHVPADRVIDFDIYAPPYMNDNVYRGWGSLQQDDVPEVVWTPRNEGHWIPTRSSLILEVLQDHERFSNNNVIIPKSHGENYKVIPGFFDPPEHTPYRLALNTTLSPKVVRELQEKIHVIAGDLIDGFRTEGKCNFTEQYAEILPITIFMTLMELPMKDVPQTKYWANQMFRPDGSISFADALQNLTDYMARHVDERSGKDGTDMLSRLINGEVDGKSLSRYEAVQLATQVVIAGLDTVVSFLGFVFHHLATHAELRHELATRPDLIPRAIDEFLRRFPIVTIGRLVRQDTSFHGVELKAGEMIAIPTMLAATDQAYNHNPLEVDVHRVSRNILTFGAGPHLCPGRHLARAEIQVTLQEWLKRIPEFMLADEAVSYKSGVVTTIPALHLAWPSAG